MSNRRTVALLLVALGLFAALTTVTPHAQALPPSATATQIRIDAVTTPDYGVVPPTLAAPYAVVTAGVDFTVVATFLDANGTPAPLASKSTNVRITLNTANGPLVANQTVAGGATSKAFTGLRITNASTGVSLHLETTQLKTVVSGDTGTFPVNKAATASPNAANKLSVGAGGGVGTSCFPTATATTCAELQVPGGGKALLSLELCDLGPSCAANRDVVGAYVKVVGAPATMVYKCDKTACQGSGVTSYSLKVQAVAGAPAETAPACPSKGVLGDGQQFCLDYRASKRDNASDLNLVLLFVEDPRVTIPAG